MGAGGRPWGGVVCLPLNPDGQVQLKSAIWSTQVAPKREQQVGCHNSFQIAFKVVFLEIQYPFSLMF